MQKFIFLIAVILMFATANAAEFYVSTTGDNNNSGASGAPWRTVQFAVNHVTAGDTIFVRDGVYNELVTFNASGSATAGYITLQNAPGQSPVLDANGLTGSLPALIKIVNRSYIRVSGFEMRNLNTSSTGVFPAGIWVRGESHHIEISNNFVHHIQHKGEYYIFFIT